MVSSSFEPLDHTDGWLSNCIMPDESSSEEESSGVEQEDEIPTENESTDVDAKQIITSSGSVLSQDKLTQYREERQRIMRELREKNNPKVDTEGEVQQLSYNDLPAPCSTEENDDFIIIPTRGCSPRLKRYDIWFTESGKRYKGDISKKYEELIAQRMIQREPSQQKTLEYLDDLVTKILNNEPGIKGAYIYGGTGTGKTFLMDLFYDSLNTRKKSRVHFYEWMHTVHHMLHEIDKSSSKKVDGAKAINMVADALIKKQGKIHCLDEMQITNISDAIVVKRIFEALFSKGVHLVTTSNRIPDDLYKDGLNRTLFMPFIRAIKEKCEIIYLQGNHDFRLVSDYGNEEKTGFAQNYFVDEHITQSFSEYILHPVESPSVNDKPAAKVAGIFLKLAGGMPVPNSRITSLYKLDITVPFTSVKGQIALFNFDDLCRKSLGPAEYFAIANSFHTVFLVNIPRLDSLADRSEVRRFISLIDNLYERQVKVIFHAICPLQNLVTIHENAHDESFAFARTLSRLIEMCSWEYLVQSAKVLDAKDYFAQFTLNKLLPSDIRGLWYHYDVNKNDQLEINEVRALFDDLWQTVLNHNEPLSDTVFQEIWDIMDIDKNGYIDVDEFSEYATKFGFTSIDGLGKK